MLAALVVIPIGFLAIGILDPETEVWRQQWDTRLPGQLVDTAVLLVGVSLGALFLGSSLAWLVSAYRFPGSKPSAGCWSHPLRCRRTCSGS